MAGAHEKTEKATPKKRQEARSKGQVAKSQDLNGAVVLLAALLALSAFGPGLFTHMKDQMQESLQLISTPEIVTLQGLGSVLSSGAQAVVLATAPIALVCMVAGVLANAAQIRPIKVTPKAIKPELKKLNPAAGFKRLFSPQSAFEGAKSVAKMTAVGVIAALAVLPELPALAALVGMPPEALLAKLTHSVFDIAKRAAAAYIVIAIIDFGYQKYSFEKNLKMDKQEVKEEGKQQNLPPEVRAAQKRKAFEMSRKRMMQAVPTADVVVTNPTHYAVALKYDGDKPAPEVIAKGKDIIAFQIRKIAEEHGVPVISDPPLARSLHRHVEPGQLIPEELFQAVAQLLAFVYRVAGRRAA
jgi:flagellar biosynthetic protein FlhB